MAPYSRAFVQLALIALLALIGLLCARALRKADGGISMVRAESTVSMDRWWDYCPAGYCPEKKKAGDTRIVSCASILERPENMTVDWTQQSPDGLHEFHAHGSDGQRMSRATHLNNSLFIDIGSYTGEDLKVFAANNPQAKIAAYEPVKQYFQVLSDNMKGFHNVAVHNVGIGPSRSTLCLRLQGDATIAVQPKEDGLCNEGQEAGQILSPDEVFKNMTAIDVVQLNCEGCEYIVLPAIYNSPAVLALINIVEVQFHVASLFKQNYCHVFQAMSQHFEVEYNYDIVWTRFRRKNT